MATRTVPPRKPVKAPTRSSARVTAVSDHPTPAPRARTRKTAGPAAQPITPPSPPQASVCAPESDNPPGLTEMRDKPRKPKLVRDSFTMPAGEYALIGEIKRACLGAGYAVKKSEVLRIGVALVGAMDQDVLKAHLDALAAIKPGRPKKI